MSKALDNLWVICGPTVHSLISSRIVGLGIFNMPLITALGCRFYPNL